MSSWPRVRRGEPNPPQGLSSYSDSKYDVWCAPKIFENACTDDEFEGRLIEHGMLLIQDLHNNKISVGHWGEYLAMSPPQRAWFDQNCRVSVKAIKDLELDINRGVITDHCRRRLCTPSLGMKWRVMDKWREQGGSGVQDPVPRPGSYAAIIGETVDGQPAPIPDPNDNFNTLQHSSLEQAAAVYI